jgi:hypothetical protein
MRDKTPCSMIEKVVLEELVVLQIYYPPADAYKILSKYQLLCAEMKHFTLTNRFMGFSKSLLGKGSNARGMLT